MSTLVFGTIVLAGCGGGGAVSKFLPTTVGVSAPPAASGISFSTALANGYIQPVCGPAAPGHARCVAYVVTSGSGMQAFGYTSSVPPLEPPQRRYGCLHNCPTATPTAMPSSAPPPPNVPTPPPPHSGGYGPDDLQSAYGIDASGGAGRTVAVVEEGDAPTLEADLGVYRTQFGLPACTTANGCFRKVGQTGTSSLPKADTAWAQETSLDVDMVSALCPNCNILVVEANSSSESDLASSANTAAQMGAVAISNSYSGSEDANYASDYNHPGIAITASSGDDGYAGGAGSPADFSSVIAVGGTSLEHANSARGWSETAWSGGGSACSSIIAKPAWQQDTGCPKRMMVDVSFVADTGTGVAIYDSTPNNGYSGWMVFGGTSVGAPAIAAIYALAGNTVSNASTLYADPSALYDVTSGSNGTCSVSYFCNAGVGYDGPTGLGTPDGIGAF
ncbi:MAG TPA: hypothetical protein VME66_11330 [Candidatus Acidoferrales bacterium]|nr:hypothetical protein [Candidatus Acidoferrales bacterium]